MPNLGAAFGIFLFLYLANKYDSKQPWILVTSCFGLMMGIAFPTERCLYSIYGNSSIKPELIGLPSHRFELSFTNIAYLIMYAIPMTFYITV